jgi:chromatin remodeling complex protein RSC6
VEISSGKCLLLPGDKIIPNNLTMPPVTPSPELGAIVGMEPLSRAELTKRVWAYIKGHELQDAQDRRQMALSQNLLRRS